MYIRYHIDAKEAPPLFKRPHKFSVKVHKDKFVPMILGDLSLVRSPSEAFETIKSRPCIYGVYGTAVGGFAPVEEKCRGCFRCVLENPEVVDVTINEEFKNCGDTYFTPSLVSTIWDEATTGKIPVKGAGYKGPFAGPGFDGIWTDFSEIVRPTRDGIHGREFISTEVDIGRRKTVFHSTTNDSVSIPIPLVFDCPGALWRPMALAAKATGTLAMVQEKEAWKEDNVVPRASLEGIEKSGEALAKKRIIEVETKSLQDYGRAKSLLPGKMIIARVEAGNDDLLADLSHVADSIHVIYDFHGFEPSGRHITQSLRDVHGRLVEEKVRDELSIIAGGGIAAAEHVPKAIICGADLVSVDIAALVALQANFKGDCRQSTPSMGRVQEQWGSQRLVNLMAAWRDQLLEILGAMGLREVRRLRGELGRAMFYEELEKEVFEPIFGRRKAKAAIAEHSGMRESDKVEVAL